MNRKLGKQKIKEVMNSSKQLTGNGNIINAFTSKNENTGNPLNSTKHKPKLSQIKNLLSTGSFKNKENTLEYFESDDKNNLLLKAISEKDSKNNVSQFYVNTNKNENYTNEVKQNKQSNKYNKNNEQNMKNNSNFIVNEMNIDMNTNIDEKEQIFNEDNEFNTENNKEYDEKKEFNKMIDDMILDHINSKNKEKKKTKETSPEKMMNYSEKNEYQRKVTNNVALEKFKQQCLQILKEDEKIKEKIELVNITDPHRFLDEYLFNDDNFLTRLEYYLLYKNGNTKNNKNTFFRNEILKVINYKTLDVEFNDKINEVISSMNLQFQMIENFKLDTKT